MIDIKKSEVVFKEFLKNYDIQNGEIKLKIVHTYGVMECSEYIAKSLKLDEEDVLLAKLIALLHDIGRFEQRKVTGEWSDCRGIDHAEYGLKILFEDNKIRNYIIDDEYDNIILKAIKNHNKYKIEDGLNDKELLHSKIIRDADKLDNFRVKCVEKLENIMKYNPETINYEGISDNVYIDFMNNKLILSEDRKTQIDMWVSFIAFIFDLNFDVSKKYIIENNYIDKLVNRINYKNPDTLNKMNEIREEAKKYLIKSIK